ncbi:hypothetical protein [Vibrio mediterranei]|uniref:hypothetical protein n=1 Tax=Vibrio mediterranei TaxID=689 RepID=UPI00148CF995|nr:hypothetical protein [Vibrio mediterranei]NOH26834.1 hypothetical protein [Vibrio mediterranei]
MITQQLQLDQVRRITFLVSIELGEHLQMVHERCVTDLHQATTYIAHIEFWLDALEDKLGLDQSCFSILLTEQLKAFNPHFERYTKTVVSEDGKYFKYKVPRHVAIEVKQTSFQIKEKMLKRCLVVQAQKVFCELFKISSDPFGFWKKAQQIQNDRLDKKLIEGRVCLSFLVCLRRLESRQLAGIP